MKKIMFVLTLFAFVFLGSCSSSDDSNPSSTIKDLVLTADFTVIDVNETVNFTVTVDGKIVTDAEIFANGVKIDYQHRFTTAGEYRVIAKKVKTNDSNTIVITVEDVSIVEPEPEPGKDSKYLGKWTPETLAVSVSGFPIPGGTLPYPHKAGCNQDTIELFATYQAEYTLHQDNCDTIKQKQAWKENGNLITIPIMGIEIEATVTAQTANSMTIETDIYKYKALVDQLLPELSALILPGMKANIKLVK